MSPDEVVRLIRGACQRHPPNMAKCVDAINALVDYGVLLDEEDSDGLGIDLLRFHALVCPLSASDQKMISEFIGGTQLLNQPEILH